MKSCVCVTLKNAVDIHCRRTKIRLVRSSVLILQIIIIILSSPSLFQNKDLSFCSRPSSCIIIFPTIPSSFWYLIPPSVFWKKTTFFSKRWWYSCLSLHLQEKRKGDHDSRMKRMPIMILLLPDSDQTWMRRPFRWYFIIILFCVNRLLFFGGPFGLPDETFFRLNQQQLLFHLLRPIRLILSYIKNFSSLSSTIHSSPDSLGA